MKISNIKERYAADHKFDIVELLRSMPDVEGSLKCFFAEHGDEGVSVGYYDPNRLSYLQRHLVLAYDIKPWSEGLAVLYINHCLNDYGANVRCVLEKSGNWSTRILFRANGLNGAFCVSPSCMGSISDASTLISINNNIGVRIEDVGIMFGRE